MNKKLVKVLLASALVLPGAIKPMSEVKATDSHEVQEQESVEYVAVIGQVVRHRMAENASPVTHIERGDKVVHKSTKGKWFEVEANGETGYVLRGQVTSEENFESEDTTIHALDVRDEVSAEEEYTVAIQTAIRTSDSEIYRPLKFLERGDVVEYQGTTPNGYFKIKDSEGLVGYVDRADVTTKENMDTESPAENLTANKEDGIDKLGIVIDSALRAQPGNQYRVVAEAKRGTNVKYLGTTDKDSNWFKVETLNGTMGYVNRGHVTKADEYDLTPSTASAIDSKSFEVNFKDGLGETLPVTIELDKEHFGVQDVEFEFEGTQYTVEVAFAEKDKLVLVKELIREIPVRIADITLDDEQAIKDAREVFDGLDDEQKNSLEETSDNFSSDYIGHLERAETKIDELKIQLAKKELKEAEDYLLGLKITNSTHPNTVSPWEFAEAENQVEKAQEKLNNLLVK